MLEVNGHNTDVGRAVRFATPDSLDAYMNRAPHTVTPVSAQAADRRIVLPRPPPEPAVDLDRLREERPDAIGPMDSASSKASTTVFSNAKPQSSA